MRPRIFRASPWLCAGLALAAVAAARAEDFEFNVNMVSGAGADVRLTVPGAMAPVGGFLPVRVRIVNRAAAARSWRLELDNSTRGYYGSGAQLRSIHTLEVPGEATREFFIFAPVHSGFRAPVPMQGRIEGPEVENGQISLGLGFSGSQPVAVEPALENSLRAAMAGPVTPSSSLPVRPIRGRRGGRGPMGSLAAIDPAAWPADWRMWSQFAAVILDQSTWDRLDAARRRALLDYVALGGRLVRVNHRDSRESFGAGQIITFGALVTGKWAELEGTIASFQSMGDLGRAAASANLWKLSARDWEPRARSRWLTVFVVVFGVVVGPVNLFLLAPAGKRQRLFLTVPAISLGASVLLFVIITLSDGVGGAGTRRAVVMLMPEQNQAAVFQQQISRTGLLGAREFALPAATNIALESEAISGIGTNILVTRTGDTAAGDWFTSRTTQQHVLSRLVPSRERVELVSAPGADPVVQSTVTTTLRAFIYRDAAGQFWTAAEVPPGVRVPLGCEPAGLAANRQELGEYLPPTFAEKGFFALGRGASELIATLPAIRWRDDLVLFTGRLGPTAAATP